VFTARYELGPYISQIRCVLKGINSVQFIWRWTIGSLLIHCSKDALEYVCLFVSLFGKTFEYL